jgi:hypothetical protein
MSNKEKTAANTNRKGSPLMSMSWEIFEEHAINIGEEAIQYLLELSKQEVELTDAQKNAKRQKLREAINPKTKKPKYSEEEIERQVNLKTTLPAMSQKIEYCKKYWKEMAPKEKTNAVMLRRQRLLEALGKSKQK